MKKYGITGNIATGKSSVTSYLKQKGYVVIDSDLLSHEALEMDEDCIKKTASLFDCLEDGSINRKKLGQIIFHDENAKKQLEAIIHPYVKKRIEEEIEKNKDQAIIFIDVPLLYELNWQDLFDQVIVVSCDEEIQLERFLKRNHYSKEYAFTIMNNQMSLTLKKQQANIIFDNNGTLESLYYQVDQFLKEVD